MKELWYLFVVLCALVTMGAKGDDFQTKNNPIPRRLHAPLSRSAPGLYF